MNLEEYRIIFVTSSLVLMLIAASPTLGLIVSLPRDMEPFSEIWVLGPTRMAEGYPFNVSANERYSVFVGVRNNLGHSAYYAVYVKFRNLTQPAPDSLNSKPSPLPMLYESRVFLADGQRWEMPLEFRFLNVSLGDNSAIVGHLSINGEDFQVNCLSKWSLEYNGFYYQLFFELWSYEEASHGFQYHDRFVSIWLNFTGGI